MSKEKDYADDEGTHGKDKKTHVLVLEFSFNIVILMCSSRNSSYLFL